MSGVLILCFQDSLLKFNLHNTKFTPLSFIYNLIGFGAFRVGRSLCFLVLGHFQQALPRQPNAPKHIHSSRPHPHFVSLNLPTLDILHKESHLLCPTFLIISVRKKLQSSLIYQIHGNIFLFCFPYLTVINTFKYKALAHCTG